MARLPQPGSDQGQWGVILNEFLTQSLTNTGSIKPNAIGSAQIAPGSVSESKLDSVVQGKLNSQSISFVHVTTGNEARPSAPLVLWIGGSVQPVNMQPNDLWFEES